jgi:hypothetical protein
MARPLSRGARHRARAALAHKLRVAESSITDEHVNAALNNGTLSVAECAAPAGGEGGGGYSDGGASGGDCGGSV